MNLEDYSGRPIMNNEDKARAVSTSIAWIFTAVQPEQILQWISLAITIVATLFTLFVNVRKWWKDSHADGVITDEEVEKLKKELEEAKEKLNENIQGNSK